jgi:thiol:disulfide interchange protein DsbD
LAFTYVQGMALTYATIGAIFALAFKQAPQAFFQQPWIVILMVLLFVALAFAMFGAYTLQMPSFLQTKFTDASNKQKAGTFVGTFVMGALSALVVTACVAPAIVAALTVIIQSREVAKGALALYVSGIGMGLPLLVVGASAGDLLPRAGAWMDTVKQLFGVLFLGVGVYLLQPLIPGGVAMLLWAALAMISGYWLVTLMHGAKQAPSVVRGFGLLILVYGVALLIGALAGRTDPLQPLSGIGASGGGAAVASQEHALPFKRIKSVGDLDRELMAAKAANKPVFLDFYADWCVSCKEMEKYTFTDPRVRSALANAVILQSDVTQNDDEDQALLKRFGIFGPPSIMFFVAGEERKNFRVVGYMKADKFHEHVTAAFTS